MVEKRLQRIEETLDILLFKSKQEQGQGQGQGGGKSEKVLDYS